MGAMKHYPQYTQITYLVREFFYGHGWEESSTPVLALSSWALIQF